MYKHKKWAPYRLINLKPCYTVYSAQTCCPLLLLLWEGQFVTSLRWLQEVLH